MNSFSVCTITGFDKPKLRGCRRFAKYIIALVCGKFSEKTMEEAGTEREDDWGPIAMANWRETPCIQGRVATEDDAKAGRAVFHFDISEGQECRPIDLDLPRCAILHEEGERDLPVIVVQAEEGNNGTAQLIAGYRPLTGGSGICMLYQLELLPGPDHRFAESSET